MLYSHPLSDVERGGVQLGKRVCSRETNFTSYYKKKKSKTHKKIQTESETDKAPK